MPSADEPPAAGGVDRRPDAAGRRVPDLELLTEGEITLEGRLVDASNTTLRGAGHALTGVTARCVYKPVAGERPLWDFPDGTLAGREVAAYLVSRGHRLGRRAADGAARRAVRPGHACQLWIDDDPDEVALVDFVPRRRLPAGLAAVLDGRGRRRRAGTCSRTPTTPRWPGWRSSTR